MDLAQLTIVICLLAGWTLVLLRHDRFALPRVGHFTIKLTHALPSVLQIALFAYWSIYWTPVITHLPVIGVQLAFAYAFEFLLAWTLRRAYSPSLGPVPIVLSMNLFVWFPDLLVSTIVIAIALLSKALLRFEGRHIFNPSVLGIAVVGVLCILIPAVFHYQDISHDFDRPPHMTEVILLLALIPQIRLQLTPVAVGAAFAMLGTMFVVFSLTGYKGGPSPWWPPWLLAITLLAADPATIPTTSASRLVFGLFLGTAFYVVSRLFLLSIGTDFFSKIIPIPMANLLVPNFERAGARLSASWPHLVRRFNNRVYLATWTSVSILSLILRRI